MRAVLPEAQNAGGLTQVNRRVLISKCQWQRERWDMTLCTEREQGNCGNYRPGSQWSLGLEEPRWASNTALALQAIALPSALTTERRPRTPNSGPADGVCD